MQIQRIQKCDHVLADKNRGEREKVGGGSGLLTMKGMNAIQK